MDADLFVLTPLFFVVALLYSSAGFGGGSSYLAILALFSLEYATIKATALLCNIMVVSNGTYLFAKAGHLNLKKIAPLIILSIPLAYLGGRIALKESIFFITLGIVLLVVTLLLLFPIQQNQSKQPKHNNVLINGLIGGGIGFLSGLVGIGGGIFLAPILHLSRWDKAKAIAGTASLFILVNSIAGLIGQASKSEFTIPWSLLSALLIAVFLGGQIGSRISSTWLSPQRIKQITAVLIFIVAIRILVKYLPPVFASFV